MLVASYRNTEASAQPKFRKETAEVINLVAMREQIRLELLEEQAEARRRWAEQREQAEALFRARMGKGKVFHNYALIERRALKVFGVTKVDLISERRGKWLVLARQFVMYWCCRLSRRSLPQIGNLMGGRHHTTVMHGRDAYVAKRAAMGRHLRQVR